MFISQHLSGIFWTILLVCLYWCGYSCILKSTQILVANNERALRKKKAILSIGVLMLICVPFLYWEFFIAMKTPAWSSDDKAKFLGALTNTGLFMLIVATVDLIQSKSKEQKKRCVTSFFVSIVFLLAMTLMICFTIRSW